MIANGTSIYLYQTASDVENHIKNYCFSPEFSTKKYKVNDNGVKAKNCQSFKTIVKYQ